MLNGFILFLIVQTQLKWKGVSDISVLYFLWFKGLVCIYNSNVNNSDVPISTLLRIFKK